MPATKSESSLKLKIILATLETDTTALADEIGEQRPVISAIISGRRRATRARRKLADALCGKVEELVLADERPVTAEKAA